VEHEPRKPQPEDIVNELRNQEEQEWQDLLNTVEASDVPLEMLKFLRVHLKDETKMVFPIIKWVKEGVSFKEIKVIVSEWYKKNDRNILGSDFIVNLPKLKQTIKAQTEHTLKDL
jgi:hypothetical protein